MFYNIYNTTEDLKQKINQNNGVLDISNEDLKKLPQLPKNLEVLDCKNNHLSNYYFENSIKNIILIQEQEKRKQKIQKIKNQRK